MQKTFFLLSLLLTIHLGHGAEGKADEKRKNDFQFEELKPFFPGTSLEDLKKTFKLTMEFDKGGSKIYKTYVTKPNYRFSVFIRIFEGKSVSFFTRLPSYFLHDVFHQSLINRFGKQDQYKKVGSAAKYTWNKRENIKIIYEGQCTITCFPVYLSIEMVPPPEGFPGSTNILKELVL